MATHPGLPVFPLLPLSPFICASDEKILPIRKLFYSKRSKIPPATTLILVWPLHDAGPMSQPKPGQGDQMEKTEGQCKCPCHKVVGLSIALIGLSFLLEAFGVLSAHAVSIIWPVLLILAGLRKAASGMCKCCSEG